MNQKLVIIGAGAVGLEAAWVLESRGGADLEGRKFDVIGYADDRYEGTPDTDGSDGRWSIDSALETLDPAHVHFHCAVGDNAAREKISKRFMKKGFSPVTLAHSTAIVASSAKVGLGSYLGAYVVVAPEAVVGAFSLLNTHAAIGHHCMLGAYTQICPGAKVSGHCTLGNGSFVGSNAVLLPKAKIGDNAVVAASSLVLKSVPAGQCVIGIPARPMGVPNRTGS